MIALEAHSMWIGRWYFPTLPALAVVAFSFGQAIEQQRSAELQPPAIAGEVSADPEVVALGKAMLSHLGTTRNTGTGFDYWPDGGIRIAYDHLATTATYATLAELSPVPVFVSGPHGDRRLQLDAPFTFGHYNPAFLRWFRANLSEVLRDRPFVRSTSEPFKKYLGTTAMTYRATYLTLNENPQDLESLLKDYKARMSGHNLPKRYYYNLAWSEATTRYPTMHKLREAYDSNVVASAVYFWLRRRIDGTDQQIFSMLDDLLRRYRMIEDGTRHEGVGSRNG